MVDSSKKKKNFHYAAVPVEYFLKLDKLNTTNLCFDLGNLVFSKPQFELTQCYLLFPLVFYQGVSSLQFM